MNIEPITLSMLILGSSFIGLILGMTVVIKSYQKNELFPVLPGQLWLLPGTGIVRIAHVGTPGKEIIYLYDNSGIELAPGTCSKKELIKNGILLEAIDKSEAEDDVILPENVVKFPFSSNHDEEF